MKKLTVLAPAKVNLALDVVGVRPNGYHELDMVMQALTLCERITLEQADALTLTLPGSDLPADDSNIALKAARRFFDYAKLNRGAAITVEKNTPVQAGMGGGSADAAGVLFGLNELYAEEMPRKLSMSELLALAEPLGADVPFALLGGTCRVRGIGEMLGALPPLADCGMVVVMPDAGVSTPAAFRAFDAVENPWHPDVAALDAALRSGDFVGVCAAAGNALEAVGSSPDTPAIKEDLRQSGAKTALMTGSGAAVFGLYETVEQAQQAAQQLRLRWKQVYVTQPLPSGPYIEV